MRFLFVYQDYADAARRLLDELVVEDVRLIIVRKGTDQPNSNELELLRRHPGASAAACEITRKYRKSVAELVSFEVEPKKFRIEDILLRQWLRPEEETKAPDTRPSESFLEEAKVCKNLILIEGCLERADDIAEHRWGFVARSAKLLARLASGEELGPSRLWDETYGVPFAANGPVSYKYTVKLDAETVKARTEWHLKLGDKTTAESAARIYFEHVKFKTQKRVVVFWVGPHPPPGQNVVDIDLE